MIATFKKDPSTSVIWFSTAYKMSLDFRSSTRDGKGSSSSTRWKDQGLIGYKTLVARRSQILRTSSIYAISTHRQPAHKAVSRSIVFFINKELALSYIDYFHPQPTLQNPGAAVTSTCNMQITYGHQKYSRAAFRVPFAWLFGAQPLKLRRKVYLHHFPIISSTQLHSSLESYNMSHSDKLRRGSDTYPGHHVVRSHLG
jgi:hypothetical protein